MSRLLVVLACLAACGGSKDDDGGRDFGSGGPVDGGLSVQDYLTQGRNAECQLQVNCCQPVTNDVVYASIEACESANSITNDLDELNAGIAAGSIVYDPVAAATCVSLVQQFAATCPPTTSAADVAQLDCPGVLTGALQAGAACVSTSSLCAPGLYCDTTTSTCLADATVGAACISCNTEDVCAMATCGSGLYCDLGANDICATLIATGQTCMNSADCQTGYCDSEMGMCAAAPASTMLQLCSSSTGTKM